MATPSHAAPHAAHRRLTVGVTGATGFVGRAIVRELVARGHTARALVRDLTKARAALPASGSVSFVRGEVFDADVMTKLCEGADALVHLIGIRRELPGGITYQRLHIDATKAAVKAATDAGTARFVHMSALGARADAPSAYHRSKFAAETLVRKSGLNWTIFRPSIIVGAEGEFMRMAAGWVRGDAPPYMFLPYFFRIDPANGEAHAGMVQPVDVGDVARAFVDSITSGSAAGEVYPLAGPEAMDWPSLLTTIRDAMPGSNHKLKPRGIAGRFASDAAKVAKKLGLAPALPFGPDEPLMAMEDSTCVNDKAREHLGWTPRPFEDSLRECAAAL